MKSASLLLALVTSARVLSGSAVLTAACGGSESGAGPDAPSADPDALASVATTLDQLPSVGRIALVGDCLVATTNRVLTCVSMTGAPSRRIVMLEDRTFLNVLPDGDGVIATTLSVGPDETMRVERVSLDGAVTELGVAGRIDATSEGQGLTLAGDRVAVTADSRVISFPRTGGAPTRHFTDGGAIGEIAAAGDDAYYVNPSLVYRYDLSTTGGRGAPIEGLFVALYGTLATDGSRVVAIVESPDHTATTVHALPAPGVVATLPGTAGRGAVRDQLVWVSAGRSIFEVELATGASTEVVIGERAVDLAVTDTALYWATTSGELRTQPRAPR